MHNFFKQAFSMGALSLGLVSFANADLPIYAAYVSDELQSECEQNQCELNSFNAEQLSQIVNALEDGDLIAQALRTSQYEVVIGNAIVNQELVMEITTSWRNIPIDEYVIRSSVIADNRDTAALRSLGKWGAHIEQQEILEAETIYSVLKASNYSKELSVPSTIGDFVQYQTAIYRDPLQGSITRYTHPYFEDAVVDISVYPVSPFNEANKNAYTKIDDSENDQHKLLIEMENEVQEIKELISHAKIDDYIISSIEATEFQFQGDTVQGYRIEVQLNTKTDPVYSTQYLFNQNDKIIKLTGNLPDFMMTKLVAESLPQIRVPSESQFMRELRAS